MDRELTKAEIGFIGKILATITVESFRKLITKYVMDAFVSSHNNTNMEYGFGDSKPDPWTLDYLKERSFLLSDNTASKLRGDLQFQLLEGLNNNENINEITRRLGTIFDSMEEYQLERIARTEVLNAQNAGRISAYKESDVVEYKMIVGAKDKRLCDTCKRMRGQIQKIEKPFVDPENLEDQWMHPPFHPNGRCTMAPLTRLPDNVIRIGGQLYATNEKIGKIEIDINALSKDEDRIWVKQTSKHIGYWRRKPGKKSKVIESKPEIVEVEPEKTTSMTKMNLEKLTSFSELGIEGGIHESNSYSAKFKDNSNAMYKVMEQGAIFGEISAYDISKILNWNVIPETVQVDLGEGEGSCQKWIEDAKEPIYILDDSTRVEIEEKHFDDLSKIFVMDMFIGNYDRHSGNVQIDKNDHCWGIDNEDLGDAGSASDFIYALDERCGLTDVTAFCPMMRWLDKNLNKEQYIIFRKKVIENMKIVIDNREEIINYYDKYNDGELTIGSDADEKSILLVILSIKENLDYIQNYKG